MLGDLRVLDTGEELLLDTERVALQPLFNMIRRYSLGYDVELHKRTLESGLLSLIGPLADELVAAARRHAGTTEHDHVVGQVGGARSVLIRTDVGTRPADRRRVTETRCWRGTRRRGRRAGWRGRCRVSADRAWPPPLRHRPR